MTLVGLAKAESFPTPFIEFSSIVTRRLSRHAFNTETFSMPMIDRPHKIVRYPLGKYFIFIFLAIQECPGEIVFIFHDKSSLRFRTTDCLHSHYRDRVNVDSGMQNISPSTREFVIDAKPKSRAKSCVLVPAAFLSASIASIHKARASSFQFDRNSANSWNIIEV